YLDDALGDEDTAQVEKALRDSEALRCLLRLIMQERDRGEHSLGAIWRRERLTCPSREQLGSYLLQVLDDGQQDDLGFHLKTIAPPGRNARHTPAASWPSRSWLPCVVFRCLTWSRRSFSWCREASGAQWCVSDARPCPACPVRDLRASSTRCGNPPTWHTKEH